MARRRIGTRHQQPRLRQFLDDQRQHVSREPLERDLIRRVPETAEEQHRVRLARAARKRILRGVDAGAQPGVDARRKLRQKAFEIALVLQRADLNVIAARQQLQLNRIARRYSKRAFRRSSGLRMNGSARPIDWK